MKERPILFSAPMVRAILNGTKTQTRRAVKDRHIDSAPPACIFQWLRERCTYGQPGDRLWVREAFMHEPADYCWEASVSIPCRPAETVYRADHDGDTRGAGWKPSIHMPRALSRILLEITSVRVEPLQDISEADAVAEGIARDGDGYERFHVDPDAPVGQSFTRNPVLAYRGLWDYINGGGAWDKNPLVWVIEFRRVTT